MWNRYRWFAVPLGTIVLYLAAILIAGQVPVRPVLAVEATPTPTVAQAWVASPIPTPSPTPEPPDRWRDAEGPRDIVLSWDTYLDLTLGGE